jgi:N6-adenosine-specific RNA methylase IME4
VTRYETAPGVFRESPFGDLPRGYFKAIYADPPWAFEMFSGQAKAPHRGQTEAYPVMRLAEMQALPVADLAAKDCALFMWIMSSHLVEAIELAQAWGFEFKTDAFYWLKQRLLGADQIDIFSGDIPAPRIGMGLWTRKQVEPCWLFTRGRPKRQNKGVPQVIIEPRREHSRKPDVARARIEQLVEGPYLELFARTQRPGWTVWGNQTDKFAAKEAAA